MNAKEAYNIAKETGRVDKILGAIAEAARSGELCLVVKRLNKFQIRELQKLQYTIKPISSTLFPPIVGIDDGWEISWDYSK